MIDAAAGIGIQHDILTNRPRKDFCQAYLAVSNMHPSPKKRYETLVKTTVQSVLAVLIFEMLLGAFDTC